MSILNNAHVGIEEQIRNWLKEKINGEVVIKHIDNKVLIDVKGDVCIRNYNEEKLPFYIIFNEVDGNFILYQCHQLSDKSGFPIHVSGDFIYEECEKLDEDDIKYVEKDRVWNMKSADPSDKNSMKGWLNYFKSGRAAERPLRDIGGDIKSNIKNEVRQWMKEHFPGLEENKDYDLKVGPMSAQYGHSTTIKYDNICTIFINSNDIILVDYKEDELPKFINFGHVHNGNFICSHSNFKSMRGFPKVVGKHFDCSFCPGITTLDNAPILVDRDFTAVNCGAKFTEEEIRKDRHITGTVYC